MKNSFENKKKLQVQKGIAPAWDALEYFQIEEQSSSTLLKHASGGSEINNSLDDLGYHSLVSTPDKSQSQESFTNVPLERQFQSTLIKQTHKV